MSRGKKMRMRVVAGAIIAVALLLSTGFSGVVYAKVPERLNTVEKVQSKINEDFMKWYEKNANRLPELSEKNIKELFTNFLEENPQERDYLRRLTYLEEKTHKGVEIERYEVAVLLSSGDYEKIKVTIIYYQLHIGGWTIKYGENDKINTYMHGKYAKEFYDKWMSAATISGIVDALVSIPLAPLALNPITAIGLAAAIAAAGILIIYESSTMDSYYESTGWQYLWLVLNNKYYYPWISIVNLASSTGMYGYNAETHQKYTFWWNVPWIAAEGLVGYVYSGYFSDSAHDWIDKHGTGWVYVR